MKLFHMIFGISVVIVFVFTGQYMDRYLQHLQYTPDLQRMLYRSRHIYILLSGLLNIGIGTYFSYRPERWRLVLQMIGSLLIVTATVLFIFAFAYEPPRASLNTPLSGRAMYLIVDGTLLHLIAGIRWRWIQNRKPED
jgi:hypothetical protein